MPTSSADRPPAYQSSFTTGWSGRQKQTLAAAHGHEGLWRGFEHDAGVAGALYHHAGEVLRRSLLQHQVALSSEPKRIATVAPHSLNEFEAVADARAVTDERQAALIRRVRPAIGHTPSDDAMAHRPLTAPWQTVAGVTASDVCAKRTAIPIRVGAIAVPLFLVEKVVGTPAI